MFAALFVKALRARGSEGVIARLFIENHKDKMLFKVTPLPVGVSMPAIVCQVALLETRMVSYRKGFGIRVKQGLSTNIIAKPTN